MSARWYTYSGVFIPGARAGAEFTNVQNAIEEIDPYGTDSGSANNYHYRGHRDMGLVLRASGRDDNRFAVRTIPPQ